MTPTELPPELWTIISVVAGGAIATAAQLIGSFLQQRRQRADTLRAERRAAYTELIGAQQSVKHFLFMFEATKEDSVADRAFDGVLSLNSIVSQIEILAPRDTARAARLVNSLAMGQRGEETFKEEEKRELRDRRASAMDAFVRLARRDLGIKGTKTAIGLWRNR